MRDNSNEPAYPCDPVTFNQGDAAVGLTKREAFAMAAMQGFMACPDYTETTYTDAARLSVRMADALLAELAKPKDDGHISYPGAKQDNDRAMGKTEDGIPGTDQGGDRS